MSKYIRYAFALIGLLITGTLTAGNPGADDITEKAFKLLKETIEQNRQNDLEGYSYKNKYVIEINLDEKWIDEQGKGDKVLASKYESISQRLNEFNNQRADKLRAYVVVVNDWELRLKQHVNIDLLPSSVKLDAISEQAEANQSEEKTRIKKELNQVPLDVYTKLKKAGYTDMAICFGANVKFYTVDAKGTPAPRQYKYSTVVFSGEKLKAYKEQIRSKIVSTSGATLENDIEMKVFSMTDGIEEIVDQQKPLALAYKVSNPTVNNWFSSIGEKTTDPYSGASTAKQVYDYTGVFSSLTKQIIDQLPDPTAQVIITDNLTSDATIENIKAQVANPLAGNVFWFHLDRKGELQTQLFLAETVKTRLGRLSTNIAGDLDLYIGNLYKQAGPKIKSPADLVDFLNIDAQIFKALGFVLDKATIPSDWWDASDPDYLLGVWGRYISPEAGYTFAYVCGIWNGVIGNLSMASGLLSLSSQLQGAFIKILVDDDYRADLFSDLQFYFSNISTLIEFGYQMVKAEISQKVETEWEKLKNGDATGVAYVAGLATVEIVITIYTAGAVEAVKAGLMSFKIIRIPVELLTKAGTWLIRPLAIIWNAGGQIVKDAGKYLLKQGDEIIASIAADGKMTIYKLLAETEKVADEIAIPQSVVNMDANGNAVGDIDFVKTEKGWGFKKRSEFLDALSKSLANYPALRDKVILLSKDLQEKFVDDFLKNIDDNLLKQFNETPEMLSAWEILSPDNVLRKSSSDLSKLSRFISETGANKKKLSESFSNTRDTRKWLDLKIPQKDLEALYDGFKNDPPFNQIPWTSEHKAQRWNNYKRGCANGENACLDFNDWSNGYDGKIDLVTSANKGVDDYFNTLGWNCPSNKCREQTLDVVVNGQTRKRRLDIYDEENLRGKEFKEYYSGKVYQSEDIVAEVLADKELLASGRLLELDWIFKGCEPSGPLRKLLESSPNSITIIILP